MISPSSFTLLINFALRLTEFKVESSKQEIKSVQKSSVCGRKFETREVCLNLRKSLFEISHQDIGDTVQER